MINWNIFKKYVVLLKLLYDELSFDRYSEFNYSW